MEPSPRLHRKWNQVRRGLFGIRRPNWKLNSRRKQQPNWCDGRRRSWTALQAVFLTWSAAGQTDKDLPKKWKPTWVLSDQLSPGATWPCNLLIDQHGSRFWTVKTAKRVRPARRTLSPRNRKRSVSPKLFWEDAWKSAAATGWIFTVSHWWDYPEQQPNGTLLEKRMRSRSLKLCWVFFLLWDTITALGSRNNCIGIRTKKYTQLFVSAKPKWLEFYLHLITNYILNGIVAKHLNMESFGYVTVSC